MWHLRHQVYVIPNLEQAMTATNHLNRYPRLITAEIPTTAVQIEKSHWVLYD